MDDDAAPPTLTHEAAHAKVVDLIREAIGVCMDADIGCEADLHGPSMGRFTWDLPPKEDEEKR